MRTHSSLRIVRNSVGSTSIEVAIMVALVALVGIGGWALLGTNVERSVRCAANDIAGGGSGDCGAGSSEDASASNEGTDSAAGSTGALNDDDRLDGLTDADFADGSREGSPFAVASNGDPAALAASDPSALADGDGAALADGDGAALADGDGASVGDSDDFSVGDGGAGAAGASAALADGSACAQNADCQSGVCAGGACEAPPRNCDWLDVGCHLANAGDTVGDLAGDFVNGVSVVADTAGAVANGVGGVVTDAGRAVGIDVPAVTGFFERTTWMLPGFGDALALVTGKTDDLWQFRIGMGQGFIDGAVGTVKGLWDAAGWAGGQVVSFVQDPLGYVGGAVSGVIDAVVHLDRTLGAAGDFIGNIARAVGDVIHTYAAGDPHDAGHIAGEVSFQVAATVVTGAAVNAARGAIAVRAATAGRTAGVMDRAGVVIGNAFPDYLPTLESKLATATRVAVPSSASLAEQQLLGITRVAAGTDGAYASTFASRLAAVPGSEAISRGGLKILLDSSDRVGILWDGTTRTLVINPAYEATWTAGIGEAQARSFWGEWARAMAGAP